MLSLWICAAAITLIALLSTVPPPRQSITFLDIGQGDAILLQDGTRQVLIDGGPGATVLERLGDELPWFDRRIEVVIATHPDRDHLEGLLHVLERYHVDLVLLPQMPHTSQLQAAWLTHLEQQLQAKKIAYRFAWQGQELHLSDELKIRILGPVSDDQQIVAPGRKTNNAAILTRVDFSDLALLLTSDAEAVVERMLVARETDLLDVDILKAGHHGSKTSTTAELLQATSPAAVVISVGKDNSYGHPHPTVLDRLKDIPTWRTDEAGSIRLVHTNSQWVQDTQVISPERSLP